MSPLMLQSFDKTLTGQIYVQGISSAKGRVVVVINTKSIQQSVTLNGGKGKTAHILAGTGPATEHALSADTVTLAPFETMFVRF